MVNPVVLETLLNEYGVQSGIKKYEVLNFGCPGYTSSQGIRLYRLKAGKYKPDIITLYFGINEANRIGISIKAMINKTLPVRSLILRLGFR